MLDNNMMKTEEVTRNESGNLPEQDTVIEQAEAPPVFVSPKLLMTRDRHLIYFENSKTGKRVRYDLKLKEMQKYNKQHDMWLGTSRQYVFFSPFTLSDVVDEEGKFKVLLEKTRALNPNCYSVSTFVDRLHEALVYENYAAEGVRTECNIGYWGKRVLKRPLSFYNKATVKFFKDADVEVTCSLEKTFEAFKPFWDSFMMVLGSMDDLCLEDKKVLFDGVIGNFSNFSDLVDVFKYDTKALCRFVIGYLVPFEGLRVGDALGLLRDYYSMADQIGRKVKKYPKYLRSMHDIIDVNYKTFKTVYDEQRFAGLVRADLEFSDKRFCVVVPRCSKDIVSEGTCLNHCVGSYVERILRGDCYILFLRSSKAPEDSLVTLELRGDVLLQAKGSYNRPLSAEERAFLLVYCKGKGLRFDVQMR